MRFIIHRSSTAEYSRKMPYANLAIAVVMERTQLDNRWQSEKWEPIGVLADSRGPGSAARVLRPDSGSTQWLHPGFNLDPFHDGSDGSSPNCNATQRARSRIGSA